MTNTEERLRAALHAIADIDAPPVRQVDVAAFRRTRTRLIGVGVAVLAVVAIGVFAIGTGFGNGAEPQGTDVVSQSTDDQLPRVLVVNCDDDSAVADVAASADGVHVEVANPASMPNAEFEYRLGKQPATGPSGGFAAPSTPTTYVLEFPPGQVSVGCNSTDSDSHVLTTVRVADPDGFYRDVDPEEVLGCRFTGTADGPTATGTSGLEAAQNYVSQYVSGSGSVVPAAGYVGDPARDFLLNSEVERAEVEVWAGDDGTFTAGIGSVC